MDRAKASQVSVKLLASVTASAGSLAAGSAAHAAVVSVSVGANIGVMYGSPTASYPVNLDGLSDLFTFYGEANTSVNAYQARITTSNNYFRVKSIGVPITIAGMSANFQQIATGTPGGTWAGLTGKLTSSASLLLQDATTGNEYGPFPASEEYYAFIFKDSNSHLRYGYFSGTLVDDGPGNAWFALDQIAYDTTGAQLTFPTAVPEPGGAGLLALGAMVTGAAGMRRLKAARHQG
jgi:hypothetical protein